MTASPQPAGASDQRFINRLKQAGPCSWLLLVVVLLLIIFPFLDTSPLGRLALGVMNSAVLVAGTFAASQNRRALLLAVAFALPALGLEWLAVFGSAHEFALPLGITMILFYAYTIANLLAFVMRPGPVTGNKLHGAIAAYILMGLMWMMIYMVIEFLVPGSFNFPTFEKLSSIHSPQLLFFSITTLTTTGYGDTAPITGYAQSAVMIEQLAGTFYVAVLIARLAGLYQPEVRGGRPSDRR